MKEFENALRQVEMRAPSADYLARGLALVAAHDGRRKLVSVKWRYATISLAVLFLASAIFNVINWTDNRPGSDDSALAFSVLRQEDGMMVYETGYAYPAGDGK